MSRAAHVLPPSLPPRGLTREQAADYCNLTPTGFDAWVRKGLMPRPIPGTKRWDVKAIDRAYDKLSGLTDSADAADDEFKQWLRDHGHAG